MSAQGLIDFTLSNARRFYSVDREPLGRERVKEPSITFPSSVTIKVIVVLVGRRTFLLLQCRLLAQSQS